MEKDNFWGALNNKWKSENTYNEEEVGEIVYNVVGELAKHHGIIVDGAKLNDLFQEFKK